MFEEWNMIVDTWDDYIDENDGMVNLFFYSKFQDNYYLKSLKNYWTCSFSKAPRTSST